MGIKEQLEEVRKYQTPDLPPKNYVIPKYDIPRQETGPILVIPDIHFPYHHEGSFDFLREVYQKWNCRRVISLGDLFDMHRTGKHLPEPEAYSMKEEIRLSREAVKTLAKIFPKMKVCFGNHDLRAFKAVKEKGITAEMMRPIADLFECPKDWEFDYEFLIDGVLYFHGDGYSGLKGAMDAAMKRRSSVVIGHLHAYGGVSYHNNGGSQIFGLNVGCLIDSSLPAFNYAKTLKDKPTLGCGVVVSQSEAYFIPMLG